MLKIFNVEMLKSFPSPRRFAQSVMRFYTHRPPTLLRTGSQIIRGFATAALYFLIFVARAGKAGGEEGGGAGGGSGGWGAGPGAGAGDA